MNRTHKVVLVAPAVTFEATLEDLSGVQTIPAICNASTRVCATPLSRSNSGGSSHRNIRAGATETVRSTARVEQGGHHPSDRTCDQQPGNRVFTGIVRDILTNISGSLRNLGRRCSRNLSQLGATFLPVASGHRGCLSTEYN
jgi:hypothetical protein